MPITKNNTEQSRALVLYRQHLVKPRLGAAQLNRVAVSTKKPVTARTETKKTQEKYFRNIASDTF